MLLATLIIPHSAWFWPAAGVLGLAALLLFRGYRTAPPGPARWVCAGLKLLGLAALAFCLPRAALVRSAGPARRQPVRRRCR